MWDDYHHGIALFVTGLSATELARMGGAEIVDVGAQLQPSIVAAAAGAEPLADQLVGDWFGPDESFEPTQAWPTGAILRSQGDLALDLVFIERAWFPLSEAGIYIYRHSTGLRAGEAWRFVSRDEPRLTFRASFGPALTRAQVIEQYGMQAGARCRNDQLTVQLRLVRE
jgi:hypothetical protein